MRELIFSKIRIEIDKERNGYELTFDALRSENSKLIEENVSIETKQGIDHSQT